MNFKSDDILAVSPSIKDLYSYKLKEVFSNVFETPTEVFLTSTGTASNSLALSALIEPFQDFGFEIKYPIQANELFVALPLNIVENIKANKVGFYEWGIPGENIYRFVTPCFTTENDLDSFKTVLKNLI